MSQRLPAFDYFVGSDRLLRGAIQNTLQSQPAKSIEHLPASMDSNLVTPKKRKRSLITTNVNEQFEVTRGMR